MLLGSDAATKAKHDFDEQQQWAEKAKQAKEGPEIFSFRSSGMRSRISSGSFSSPRRAPIRATSFTTSGAGVATATSSHSSMESRNPPRAPISSRNAWLGLK